MKALTVCQPWAWAIVHGPKTVENRSWATNYRGPLLIHAGKSRRFLQAGIYEIAAMENVELEPSDLPFGAIVGICDLVDCVWISEVYGDWAGPAERLTSNQYTTGPFAWVLAARRKFTEPIPWRGAQGLFDVAVGPMLRIAIDQARAHACCQAPRACLWCGCTDARGCPEGCEWAGPEICSVCAEAIADRMRTPRGQPTGRPDDLLGVRRGYRGSDY